MTSTWSVLTARVQFPSCTPTNWVSVSVSGWQKGVSVSPLIAIDKTGDLVARRLHFTAACNLLQVAVFVGFGKFSAARHFAVSGDVSGFVSEDRWQVSVFCGTRARGLWPLGRFEVSGFSFSPFSCFPEFWLAANCAGGTCSSEACWRRAVSTGRHCRTWLARKSFRPKYAGRDVVLCEVERSGRSSTGTAAAAVV